MDTGLPHFQWTPQLEEPRRPLKPRACVAARPRCRPRADPAHPAQTRADSPGKEDYFSILLEACPRISGSNASPRMAPPMLTGAVSPVRNPPPIRHSSRTVFRKFRIFGHIQTRQPMFSINLDHSLTNPTLQGTPTVSGTSRPDSRRVALSSQHWGPVRRSNTETSEIVRTDESGKAE